MGAHQKKKNSWWQTVLLLIGLAMLFIMLPALIIGQYQDESSTDSQTTGTVTSVRAHAYKGSRGCVLEYRTGATLRKLSDVCSADTRAGDELTVYYEQANPTHATVKSPAAARTGLYVGLGALGLPLLIMTVLYFRAPKVEQAA